VLELHGFLIGSGPQLRAAALISQASYLIFAAGLSMLAA
jgi:hypothetical protein